jgi:hypothetical protein
MLLPRHASHAILSIEHVIRSTIAIEDGRRGRQLLEATSGLLAICAIAGGGQNRSADDLQFYFAAAARPGEMFLLFLFHCNRPFVAKADELCR